jgi:hypothetical protein
MTGVNGSHERNPWPSDAVFITYATLNVLGSNPIMSSDRPARDPMSQGTIGRSIMMQCLLSTIISVYQICYPKFLF